MGCRYEREVYAGKSKNNGEWDGSKFGEKIALLTRLIHFFSEGMSERAFDKQTADTLLQIGAAKAALATDRASFLLNEMNPTGAPGLPWEDPGRHVRDLASVLDGMNIPATGRTHAHILRKRLTIAQEKIKENQVEFLPREWIRTSLIELMRHIGGTMIGNPGAVDSMPGARYDRTLPAVDARIAPDRIMKEKEKRECTKLVPLIRKAMAGLTELMNAYEAPRRDEAMQSIHCTTLFAVFDTHAVGTQRSKDWSALSSAIHRLNSDVQNGKENFSLQEARAVHCALLDWHIELMKQDTLARIMGPDTVKGLDVNDISLDWVDALARAKTTDSLPAEKPRASLPVAF